MKIDWKAKLTSRKFWAAIVGVMIAVFAVFNIDDLTTEKVVALVSAVGILTAYIVGEGFVDAKRIENKNDDET